MATGTKTPNTSEEQDAAYNPGDAAYNDQFNARSTAKNLSDMEEGAAKGTHTDAHGDVVKNNYNADDPEPTKNIDDVNDKEKSASKSLYNNAAAMAGTSGFTGKLGGTGKKLGPTGGIIGVLLFGFIVLGGGSMSLAGSLLINLKEIFHNDRSDSTRANKLYSRAFMANKFNSEDEACKGSKIKCKLSTMSKADVKQYIREGFKIKGAELDADGKNTGKRIEDDPAMKPDTDNDPNQQNNNDDDNRNQHDPKARVSVEEIEFPDGTKAKNGKEFYAHADNHVSALRSSERGFNSRSAFYLNKFFSNSIMGNDGKFKFSKAKKEFPDAEGDKAKEEQDKAFNDQTDGLSDEDKEGDKLKGKVTEVESDADEHTKGKNGGVKGSLFLTAAQIACQSYKLARGSVAAVKLYQIAQLGKFGLMFLQSADEIKDGRGDGPKTTYLSDNLTYYENNEKMKEDSEELDLKKGDPNPKYNLSATDSQGYKIAAHGDVSSLTLFAQAYILGGSGIIRTIDNYTKKVEDVVDKVPLPGDQGTGREKIKTICRGANSGLASIIGTCATLIPGLATLGSAAPGPGTIAGLLIGGGFCTCVAISVADGSAKVPEFVQKTLLSTLIGPFAFVPGVKDLLIKNNPGCKGMQAALEAAKDEFIEILKEKVFREYIEKALKQVSVGSDTKGVDAGNAIAAGVGLVLSTTATGYGTKPAKSKDKNKEVTDYIAATQALEDKYIALDKDDARQNPLDATNQYSLLGSLVRSFNLSDANPTSLYGNLLTVSHLLPSAAKTVVTGQPVSALYNQPSTAADGDSGRYDCEDDDLKYIGATGDKFCSIVGVVSNEELKNATQEVEDPKSKNIENIIDYMAMEGRYKNIHHTPETLDGYTDNTDGQCTKTDGSEDERVDGHCKASMQPAIDGDGKPTPDSSYDKYLTYCTDKREQPWGAQVEPFEQGTEKDQEWYSGKRCTEDTMMMRNFRMYTNYCLQSGTRDGTSNCYTDDETAVAAPAESNEGGDWVMPTSGVCTSPYGPRSGSMHAGVDIAPPSGTPIVAPTSMKIIYAADKSDGYGYSVVARATDGSKYMFRFGHMIAQPPVKAGQEVSKGQVIGNVGNTGNSFGDHLHFEIYDPSSPDGAYAENGKPLDPIPILQKHKASPPSC